MRSATSPMEMDPRSTPGRARRHTEELSMDAESDEPHGLFEVLLG